jgi:hypothetical protein
LKLDEAYTESKIMKRTAGIIIFLFGIFLFLGNQVGFFKTFPFAGFITMGAGGLLMKPDEERK